MHRSRLILPIAALSLVLAACGGGGDTPSEAASEAASEAPASVAASAAASEAAPPSDGGGESAEVRLEGFAFDTEELTIAAGTEVSFVNADSAPHTVTEGANGVAVDSPIIDEELDPSQETSFTFDEPGTYEITCLLHPTMNTTIIVEG